MKQTDFFFSSAVDLKRHSLSEQNMNAMYAVYDACKLINQPNQYGSSIKTIIITAVHQDYSSKFHKPFVIYRSNKKAVKAKVKVDLEQVLKSGFIETAAIYEEVIAQVLDQIKDQVSDFDFEKLKLDLHRAIQEETKVLD